MAASDRFGRTVERIRARPAEPVDAASLAAFRIAFGLIASWSALRFVLNGWIEQFFGRPTWFFPYAGFEWIPVPSVETLTVAFGAMTVLGLMIAAGLLYRFAVIAFGLIFTWVELIDVTNYLNHYYLVSLFCLLLAVVPAHRVASVDSWRGTVRAGSTVPRWCLWLLRFQVATVYIFAGLAKLGPDWLLHGQPLNLWFSSRAGLPVIGPLLAHWELALLASWAGFLHDLLIVPALLWRRTRRWAFAALVVFHVSTGLLFNIGLFPVIMTTAATLFFAPDWPRKVAEKLGIRGRALRAPDTDRSRRARSVVATPVLVAVVAYCAIQVLVPLRSHLYGGDVLWHEQGMRWSWKVMVREKNGAVTYRVRLPDEERTVYVSPSEYLTPHQEREMSGQPDLIVRLAHQVAADWRARGHADVAVHADALVSLNGRQARPMIDPSVDLTTIEPSLRGATWILPGPNEPPRHLTPPRPHVTFAAADGTR